MVSGTPVDDAMLNKLAEAVVALQPKPRKLRWVSLSLCVVDAVWSIGANYDTVVVPMEKTNGSLDPAEGCAVLPCQETAKVELVMDADDTGMVTVTGSATVECSY